MSSIFPSETTWITPRSVESKVTSNNCQIILNQKIEKIDRILVKASTVEASIYDENGDYFPKNVSQISTTNNQSGLLEYLDITAYVVEKAKYDTLSIADQTSQIYNGLYLQNASYWTKNSNTISIIGESIKGSWEFWGLPALANIIQSAVYVLFNNSGKKLWYQATDGSFRSITGIRDRNEQSGNNPMSAQFRVYYTPLGESVKLKSVKVNPQPQQFTIPFSQQQPIVNNTTMGKEMQSIANRTGCETMQIMRTIPDMSLYRDVGTVYYEKDANGKKTGNVWRLTKCEISIYSDTYIKVLETWSKNWTYRSPNVPINREFRSWNIPADYVQRNMAYHDFCVFSRTNLSNVLPKDAIISGVSRETLARKIHDQTDIRKEMSNVWFMRENSSGSNNPNVGAILSCSAFGFGYERPRSKADRYE